MRDSRLHIPQLRHRSSLEIHLLGGFQFSVKGRDALPELPTGSQRLLAFLALRENPVERRNAAENLWPDASEDHANASLRSSISRLTQVAYDAIVVSYHSLRLADDVAVDIRASRALALRLVDRSIPVLRADLSHKAVGTLSADLLPDWYDDWAIVDAEQWRQLRLRALTSLSRTLSSSGRYGDAIAAAAAVVAADPLREAAQVTLIRVHLAEGNRGEAISVFQRYRALLLTELGLEPSPRLWALMKDCLRDVTAA